MSEETIELFYISDYEDPETGEVTEQIEGVSIVSREAFLHFFVETEWEPCECQIQGCLSCFLDEERAWADGYGANCTLLWFGNDPATGKHWEPEAVLAERRKQAMHECQYCYEDVDGEDSEVWEGGHYHPHCLEEMRDEQCQLNQMVEYDHEKHEGMAQCDACEEWFPPMKTVMVDEKMFIQKCLECYDGEDARAYSFSNDDIYEDYSDELPPEEEE